MENPEFMKYIEFNNDIMVGKPVIKGARLTVEYILKLLSKGSSVEEIQKEYQGLTREQILSCIAFASYVMENNDYIALVK